jgi:hypothetical protein
MIHSEIRDYLWILPRIASCLRLFIGWGCVHNILAPDTINSDSDLYTHQNGGAQAADLLVKYRQQSKYPPPLVQIMGGMVNTLF